MTLARLSRLLPALVFAAGCASKTPPPAGKAAVPTPLESARAAVREAQAARAEEQAPEAYRAALEFLRQAEAGSGAGAREAAIRAEGSARLAAAQVELKQVRERLALTQQALEQAETELIRSKARLKGTETKAEASSAIAEARILLRRLRARSAAATLCQESLVKAEQQLARDNYGAAVFFALKAQDIANRALAGPTR
jgi:hypothetical protein